MYVLCSLFLLETVHLWLTFIVDWEKQFPQYALRFAGAHLSKSSPSAELMELLQKLSFEDLIGSMHVYLATLSPENFQDISTVIYFPQCIWETIFLFPNALQALVCLTTHLKPTANQGNTGPSPA